ncbi:MAG: hypothetical protein KDK27_03095 [Leptospiraceae bacterium]|nr:hypothetical protein [Leptospiraceae bacterium]
MNINHAVDKAYEDKSLEELLEAPISALQGVSEDGGQKIAEGLRIKNTIGSLANSKYVRWAQAIAALAEKEQS